MLIVKRMGGTSLSWRRTVFFGSDHVFELRHSDYTMKKDWAVG